MNSTVEGFPVRFRYCKHTSPGSLWAGARSTRIDRPLVIFCVVCWKRVLIHDFKKTLEVQPC